MTPIDELRQLCEQYRKANKYQFCDVRHKGKYIYVLFWSVVSAKDPEIIKSGENTKRRYNAVKTRHKRFNSASLPVQIEIMKQKLKENGKA